MPMITLVNCFEIPAGREDEFFALWQQVNTYMRQKRGYLEHKLHRSLAPDAPFRFINVARWASKEEFDAAHDDGFRALVSQPAWAAFRSRPALYEVVHEAVAETRSHSWRLSAASASAFSCGALARGRPYSQIFAHLLLPTT